MQSSPRLLTIYFSLLCLLAFAISLPFIVSSVSIGLVAVAWLAQFNRREIARRFRERKMVWLWLIFFIQLTISYFYSADKTEAAIDLQKKISFLVLPLVIGLGPAIPAKWLNHIFTAFTSGIVVIACFCIGRGAIYYFQTGQVDKLFYHSLVSGLGINAVYYSSYVIFALGILLLHEFSAGFLQNKWLRYSFQIISLVFFVLLSSKSLLVLFVVFVLPLSLMGKKNRNLITPRKLALIAAATVAIVAIILSTNNPIRSRYTEIFVNNQIISEETKHKGQEQVFNNLSLRLFLWQMAWNNINEHDLWLTGCGVGDVGILQKGRIALYDAHTKALYNQPDLSVLNLHNMYLQVLMTLGIPGLLIFLLIVLTPFSWLKRLKNKEVFLIFLVSYLLYMMQESALQTQAGVVYFTFFYQVFMLVYCAERDNKLDIA